MHERRMMVKGYRVLNEYCKDHGIEESVCQRKNGFIKNGRR